MQHSKYFVSIPYDLGRWHIKKIMLYFASAMLLFLSWYFPPFNKIWQVIDMHGFYLLNGTMAIGKPWQQFFGFLNSHTGDLVLILFLAVLSLIPGVVFEKIYYKRLLLTLFGLIVFVYLTKWVFIQGLALHRLSPSMVFPTPYVIPKMTPNLVDVRFYGTNVFPSDHGIVIFSWLLFVFCYGRKLFKPIAFILAALLLMPRLMVGAHWITDEWVGGFAGALIYVAIFCFTPLSKVFLFRLPK